MFDFFFRFLCRVTQCLNVLSLNVLYTLSLCQCNYYTEGKLCYHFHFIPYLSPVNYVSLEERIYCVLKTWCGTVCFESMCLKSHYPVWRFQHAVFSKWLQILWVFLNTRLSSKVEYDKIDSQNTVEVQHGSGFTLPLTVNLTTRKSAL